MVSKWNENKLYCLEQVNKNPKLIMTRKNKGGFDGNYLTWTLVYKWMVKNYDFVFEVNEIKTTNDGANGYVKATLIVNEDNKEYIELASITMDLNCKDCNKDWKTCELHKHFEENEMIPFNEEYNKDNCRYSYSLPIKGEK